MATLPLSMLGKAGLPTPERIGDSTEHLAGIQRAPSHGRTLSTSIVRLCKEKLMKEAKTKRERIPRAMMLGAIGPCTSEPTVQDA